MTHREVIELLPWYANQTLKEGERREVEAHLLTCTACAGELGELRMIQTAVVESSREVSEPSRNLFNQAMAKVEEYERGKAKVEAKSFAGIRELLAQLGETLFWWWGSTPALARALVAAQFVLIVGLAGGLTFSLWNRGDFSTLSGPPEGRSEGTTIVVRFNESATEAQLRQALGEIQGAIVSGPSPLGLYSIEVPIAPTKTAEIEKLLRELRERQPIISFAEKK